MTKESHGSNRAAHIYFLGLLPMLAGGCALAYEILLMRRLTSMLGDMYFVHAALLATFLAGFGLGSKLAVHWVRHLATLEIATGGYVLLLLYLSDRLSHSSLTLSGSTLSVVTVVILLTAPLAILVGATVPIYGELMTAIHRPAAAFRSSYSVYHLGTILGVVVVEFILIRALGITHSMMIAAAANVAMGIGIHLLRFEAPVPFRATTTSFSKRVLIAVVLAGVASAMFQMFFIKLSFHLFTPHRENFAIGVLIALAGIFVGCTLVNRFSPTFSLCLLATGISIGAVFTVYPSIVPLYLGLSDVLRPFGLPALPLKLLFAALIGLPTFAGFGAAIPALIHDDARVARDAGQLLFVGGLANALGCLLYVFLAHEYLSGNVFLSLLIGLLLVAALAADQTVRKLKRQWVAVAIASVMLNAAWQENSFYLPKWAHTLNKDWPVRVYKSGPDSATVIQEPRRKWLSYNGHNSIYLTNNGVANLSELLSGALPAIHAPSRQRALVLGLGTGMTAGATAQLFEHTDIVEINRAFVSMMPDIRDINLDIANNTNSSLYVLDARTFLQNTSTEYDVIINSIPAPDYYSASKIYTEEFHDRVLNALKPGGIYCTWLAVPNMTEVGIVTILTSLHRRYSNVHLYLVGQSYYFAVCGNGPLPNRSLAELKLPEQLQRTMSDACAPFILAEVVDDIRLSTNLFKRFQPPDDVVLNTDDRPVLEFLIGSRRQAGGIERDFFFDNPHHVNISSPPTETDPARMARRIGLHFRLGSPFYRKSFEQSLRTSPELQRAWNAWQKEMNQW